MVKLVIFNSLEPMNQALFMSKMRLFINCCQLTRFSKATSLLSIGLFLASCTSKPNKTGYIDINVINKEYKLSQKYESYLKGLEDKVADELIGLQNQIKQKNDSLKAQTKRGQDVPQEELKSFYQLRTTYKETREVKLKAIEDSTLKYRNLLNSDINQKVYQYGAENNFQYVYNPAGSGTFMYADSTLDITKDVVRYLNTTR